MVLLKNNSGFPVSLPFTVGGANSLNTKQAVKANLEEYERLKKEHPLVLKGLMVFLLKGASAKKKAPAVKKKSVSKMKKADSSLTESGTVKEEVTGVKIKE